MGKIDKEDIKEEEIKKTVPLLEEEQIMRYKGITITKRKDGRYMAKPTYNGKQYSIYGKTQIECYENLKLFFKNKPAKREVTKSITLYEWLDKWYKTYKVGKLKPGSLYQIHIPVHIHPRSIYTRYYHKSGQCRQNLTPCCRKVCYQKTDNSRFLRKGHIPPKPCCHQTDL